MSVWPVNRLEWVVKSMNSGVYAVIDLAGSMIAPGDAVALGLSVREAGFSFRIDDKHSGDSILQDAARCTILLGHIGDALRISRELGVAGGIPPVELARCALDSWSNEAAARLPGEWMLLDWQPGCVTIMQSAARWVRTFYTRHGDRIAVSPDIFSLSRLGWIGRDIDEEGFMLTLARGALHGTRTILPNVSELGTGECIRFTRDGTTTAACLPFVATEPWTGSFAQATEQAKVLLQQIIGERLARHGDVACLLSGGLDSSLLTMMVADGLRSGQRAICLTSVAPPGSGLADEYDQARLVADSLGLDLVAVAPGPIPGIYAPDVSAFAEANGPSLSVRHYLYKALADQARALGVTGIFDGSFGEMTVTGLMPLHSWRWQLREYAKRLLGRGFYPEATPFRVRFAPHRLQTLSAAVNAATTTRSSSEPIARLRHEAWGYFPGVAKIMRTPANVPGSATIEHPFRDQRLLQLFAAFPALYLEHEGLKRAPARSMMAGLLPDSIRLRKDVKPFSPDYDLRLTVEAPAARARIAAFRKAEIADWLDLDWLDTSLARIAAHGPRDIASAFEVQLTAMTAEFLLWWRTDAG